MTTLFINIIMSMLFPLPVAFLLNYIFRKRIINKKTRYLTAYVGGYIISSLLVLLYIIASTFRYDYNNEQPFSQKEWAKDYKERYKMSKDIIESKLLINKKKAEVIDIIGKPQEEEKGKAIYLTGAEGSLYPTFYFLKVHYKNDTVIQVESYKVDED